LYDWQVVTTLNRRNKNLSVFLGGFLGKISTFLNASSAAQMSLVAWWLGAWRNFLERMAVAR
jgi:hypothetical protein